MKTTDIFNIKPQTTRSIKSRESQTFQHQNIFNHDNKVLEQHNKDKIDQKPLNKSIDQSPLKENSNNLLRIDNNQQIDQQSKSPQYENQPDDYSRNRKFKSWQSNIFNEPAKENFNKNLSRVGNDPNDKINIGAFNINWWDTQNYPQTQQDQQSPAKLIQEHNKKLGLEYLTPQIQQQKEIRKSNKNYSDIFDAGLARYYDLPKQNSLVIVKNQQAHHSIETNKQSQNASQYQQATSQNIVKPQYDSLIKDKGQDDLGQYAKRLKLRGMSSVFDTHDYYNKLIQETSTSQVLKPQNSIITVQENSVQSNTDLQFKFVKIVVRGLNSKFDKDKFRQFCQTQNCHVANIKLGKDEKKRQTHQFVIKCSFQNQKDLTNIEMYLLSQSGRIVKKEIIPKEDYIANLGLIQESIPNKNLIIVQNQAKQQQPKVVQNNGQKRATSAKQSIKRNV